MSLDPDQEQAVHSCKYCESIVFEPPGCSGTRWKTYHDPKDNKERVKVELVICREPQQAFEAADDGCLLYKALLKHHAKFVLGIRDPPVENLVLELEGELNPLRFTTGLSVSWESSDNFILSALRTERRVVPIDAFETFAEDGEASPARELGVVWFLTLEFQGILRHNTSK